jgi:uncharacterized membrane protein YoaK (UPF0700 family)
MAMERRLTYVFAVSLAIVVGVWIGALASLVSVSTAVWLSAAVGLGALVAAKVRRHAELPGSVKLH